MLAERIEVRVEALQPSVAVEHAEVRFFLVEIEPRRDRFQPRQAHQERALEAVGQALQTAARNGGAARRKARPSDRHAAAG